MPELVSQKYQVIARLFLAQMTGDVAEIQPGAALNSLARDRLFSPV
jgi:hypothetical protein